MECRPRTRLNIMLPDIPGLGVWRLETDGWNAATSLPATIEMLLALSVQPWVKAVLRLEQRSAKKRQPDGKVVTHRFAVPVLDTPDDLTLGRIVGQRMRQEQPQQLPETVPQTARERVAAQRAEIEAQTTSGRRAASVGHGEADIEQRAAMDASPAMTSGPGDLPEAGSGPAGADAGASTPDGHPGSGDTSSPRSAQPDEDPEVGNSLSPASGAHPSGPGGAPPPSGPDMPPPPDTATAVCGDDGGMLGTCTRAPRHRGRHQGPGGEWPQEKRK